MRRALAALAGIGLAALGSAPARAQLFDRSQFFGSGLGSDTLHGAAPFGSPIPDDRVYIHGYFDQLEGRFGSGDYLRWDGQGWIGNDHNKLWLKSEGRFNPNNRGRMEDGDHEALYDRPINTFLDLQAGVRVDLDSNRTRTWAALGVQGLSIGFWNVEATVYASTNAHYALRTNASYDLYLTQRLVLQPQFETNWYTKEDRPRGIGAGLSDIDMGLRIRYDITRKLSPYIGVAYQRRFGGTEGLTRESGGKVNDVRFLLGLRTWF